METGYWSRLNKGRISRRNVIRGGGMASVGVALALVGCGDEDSDSDGSASTPAGDQQQGGEIVVALNNDPVSFDPHIEASYRTQWTAGYAYNKLMRLTPDMEIVPDLATGYEAVSDTEIVFKLHEGAPFHDVDPVNGRAVTSADAKYSLERIVTPQPEFQRAYMFEAISEMETPDDNTLVIRTAEPFAPLMSYIANPFSVIVAPEAVEASGDLRQTVIGTGPFQYDTHTRESNYQMRRFENYFAEDRPHLDRIRVNIMPDRSSRVSATLARELHIEPVSGDDAAQFSGDNWVVHRSDQGGQTNIRFNATKAPFDDARVRRAFDLAVNKNELMALAIGGHGSLTGPVGPGIGPKWALMAEDLVGRPGYRDNKEEDYAEARKLLDAAGIGELSPEWIYYTPATENETVAVAVDQQMRSAGINVTPRLEKLDYAGWIPRMLDYQYEVTSTGSGFRDNPDEYIYALFRGGASRNDTGYDNPELNEMLDRQRTLMNEEERSALVLEINERLLEEAPNSWLYADNLFEVVDSRLQGYGITYSHNRANRFEYFSLDA